MEIATDKMYSRARVVHIHHHHYSDGLADSSEDQSVEEEEDEYMEDAYIGAEDYYDECDSDDFYGEEEVDFSHEANSIDSEFSSEEESHFACTTSCDEHSSLCSGYDESSY